MQLDVQLDAPPSQAAERARWFEAAGVDGVFTFEGRHDVFLPLALAASATRLRLMTNIAVALPRSPLHLAHITRDLQELSSGRFVLGLGSQVRTHIERRYGSTWSRPAARMREQVGATREILTAWQEGRAPQFHGEFTRHDLMPPIFTPPPLEYPLPPVMMGALGPLMTRTAGAVSDGLLVMPFTSRRYILEASLPALQAGAGEAGRDPHGIAVHPQVITAIGTSPDELAKAIDGARGLLAFYGSTPAYRPVLELHDRGDLQPRLQELIHQGEITEAMALIDDDLFDTIAVRGNPSECADLIAEKFAGIGDRVCAYFPGMSPSQQTIRALADGLHARDTR